MTAEFVMLPIYDANGLQTGRSLKVDTRNFLGSAGSETAHRYIDVVDDRATFEVEMLDRIVSGLAPRRDVDDMILHNSARVKGDVGMANPNQEKTEHGAVIYRRQPKTTEEWRTIQGFEAYKMNENGVIVDVMQDNKRVENAPRGRRARPSVMLRQGGRGGIMHLDLEVIYKNTFPEHANMAKEILS